MTLAALLVEPKPKPLAAWVVVLNFHVDHGGDTRKGVAHHPKDCLVANADDALLGDGVQKQPSLG